MTSPTRRTACVGSGSSAGGPSTRPSRTSNEAPCKGHTSRVARSRPSHGCECEWVQMLSRANTPSRVWKITTARPPMTRARMLPGGTSASVNSASNCGMAWLELDLGLEYRHRLADDPHAREGLAAEFELDLDPSGPMQRVSLDAGEARALAAAREQLQLRQIRPEQPVGVAADRILGDAERRAEHARLGQVVRGVRREGEDEVAGRADLRRQRREPCDVGFQMLEGLGPAHSDQQPRTARTDDTQRYAGVETLGGERQRIEHREPPPGVELAPHGRGFAANRDAPIRPGRRDPHAAVP